MAAISQKEYLKRYLQSDDKLKKKKKKSKDKPAKSTVKIIDDSDFASTANDHDIDESELYALNEEAPQIVGVIDERAPSVIMKQEYQESGKWKKLGDEGSGFRPVKKKHRNQDSSSVRRRDSPDESPPRKRKVSTDQSPLRRKRQDSDASPPRRRNHDSDESPPRRRPENQTSRQKSRSPVRKNRRDSDASPPRKNRRDSDASPPRRNRHDSDASSPRRNRRDSDQTPPRRRSPVIKKERRDSDNSPPRRSRRPSRSPSRRSRWSPTQVKCEPESPQPGPSRMTKTLDGKASGLQDAKTLKRENDAFRERQDKMFKAMRPEMLGKDAEVVIRDRRGKNRDFEMSAEEERRKSEAEAARQKEYDRWGKGLKQVEDTERRFQEFMHEANKPFARGADDEDMHNYLKEQERLDDPMLEYMRRKKKEKSKKEGVVEKPIYQGQFPDNRYNIRPGYRWDGVDRSNGYEKKFFANINSKKSLEEDAYRYSTEDM